MKRALLGLMAHTGVAITADSNERVKQFSKLATWPTGTITFEGFREAVNRQLNCDDAQEKEIEYLFRKVLDQTGDGEVHYTEFLASTLCVEDTSPRQDVAEGWLRDIFERLDTERCGSISVEDFRMVIGDHYA